MTDVLVVGAGPVGLTMACELARHGLRCRIIDRADAPLPYCRAIGVTPRTLEVWEDMGIARTMIDAGLWITGMRSMIGGRPPFETLIDFSDLPFSNLGLPQYETERLLTRHLAQYGITIDRGVALESLQQDADGVTVTLNGATHRFAHVIGCDGAHSAVRHALAIPFEGEAMPMTFMLGDVHLATDLPYGMALRAVRPREDAPPDLFVAIPLPEPGRYRVSMVAPEAMAPAGGSAHGIQSEMAGPDLAALQSVADDLLPDRPVLSDLRWSSIFRISMRLAAQYRVGRVFIAGDAAHIHPPTGGQGMNTGIQDAYNLAWKLAAVLSGRAPESLLDSYEAERRPVGADVVARTLAASINYGREGAAKPHRLEDTQLLVNYRDSAWVHDDGGPDDGPRAGDRAPDAGGLRRHGVGFPLRLFDLLRGTEPVLMLHRPTGPLPAIAGLRVLAITAEPQPDRYGVTTLHDAEGAFAAAYGGQGAAWLIRPDGYIAWRGPGANHPGLHDVLARVFGRMGEPPETH
jgi:2-polyprenyl-6-methoxyphenol hydroxylase-like FAD-dependent oxidoreductase